jgi:hypothetical protein
MNPVVLFLIAAVLIATFCFLVLGAWLLPMLGLTGIWLSAIPGAISGGTIALIYFNMFKRPNGA